MPITKRPESTGKRVTKDLTKKKHKRALITGITSIAVVLTVIGGTQIKNHNAKEQRLTAYAKTLKESQQHKPNQLQNDLKHKTANQYEMNVPKLSPSQGAFGYFTTSGKALGEISNQITEGELKQLRSEAIKQGYDKKFLTGYVKISSIGITLPIYKGTNKYTLALGATTYYPGQMMGQGNYVLAGHNMDNIGGLFTDLPKVKDGAIAELISADKTYKYRIKTTSYVNPHGQALSGPDKSESTIMSDKTYHIQNKKVRYSIYPDLTKGSKPMLTLFACNDSGNKRFVAHGSLIN